METLSPKAPGPYLGWFSMFDGINAFAELGIGEMPLVPILPILIGEVTYLIGEADVLDVLKEE